MRPFAYMMLLLMACPLGAATTSENPKPPEQAVPELGPANTPQKVSAALGSDLKTVKEAYALELDGHLTWVVIKLAKACSCPVSEIMRARETRHWGEVATLYGQDFQQLSEEVGQLAKKGVLAYEPRTIRQVLRAGANHPDKMKLPPKKHPKFSSHGVQP